MCDKKQKPLIWVFLGASLPLVLLLNWLVSYSGRQVTVLAAPAIHPISPTTDLVITQQVSPNPVLVGATAVYTLQVTNVSTIPLPVLISNSLPLQVTPTGTLTWTPIISDSAAWIESVAVTVPANTQGELVNEMTVTVPTSRADNRSYCTTCAEEDNINIPIYGVGVTRFRIVATHPAYTYTTDNCDPDFSGCTLAASVPEDVTCQPLWDDGLDVITVCSDSNWWLPQVMTVTVGSDSLVGHRLVWNRKIADEASWPEVLVFYQDGNLRIKPHPRSGQSDVCYGSSVIVGAATPDDIRPFAEVATIVVDPPAMALDVTYQNGESAHLELAVDRSQTQIDVWAAYETTVSFATFRSMYVAEDNADAARVTTAVGDYGLLDISEPDWRVPWTTLSGPRWFFYRQTVSTHNTSAPDILLEALDGYANHTNTLIAPVHQFFIHLPVVLRSE